MYLKLMDRGKQCGAKWNAIFCGVWLGSTLFGSAVYIFDIRLNDMWQTVQSLIRQLITRRLIKSKQFAALLLIFDWNPSLQ